VLYLEDTQTYAFEVFDIGTFVRNDFYVTDALAISNNDITLSSNVHINGNLTINENVIIDSSGVTVKYNNTDTIKMDDSLNIFTSSYFNDNVLITDSQFIVRNNHEDVFKIEGSNVYFNNETLERFQKNINLSGKLYGNDEFDTIDAYVDVVCYSNLQINGSLVSATILNFDSVANFTENVTVENDLIVNSNIYVHPNNDNSSWWKIYSDSTVDEDTFEKSTVEADLIFKSKNGAVMRFHDTFEESIINFTGQHRCTICMTNSEDVEDLVGLVVVSTSMYKDLHDNSNIRINEAIPIVQIASFENDKAVFGVISGIENDVNTSTFSIGHISFILNKTITCKKVMINSVGEGGIWVCNINGNLENGDYISSSKVQGLGMFQNNDFRMNYTVAKITCNCTFELASPVYKCVQFECNGQTLRKAFVGCVYCC
jgi:hypothetical protein